MQTSITTFNRTVEKSHAWLKELKETGNFLTEDEAYTALRSVLHTLRDRLLVDQAAHLASEMPMLIRGMFYEGWKPSTTPTKDHTKDAFLDKIQSHLRNASNRIEPEEAVEAVFHFLDKKISQGEIQDVKCELPKEILSLWQ